MSLISRTRSWLSSLFSTQSRQKTIRRKAKARRSVFAVETLEDRTVPTIVFTPQFGQDTFITNPPYNSADTGVMSSATVYLILWGPAWNTAPGPGQSNANTIINQATAVINSGQINILKQYGSDGKVSFGGDFIDTSAVPVGFGVGTGSGFVGTSFTEAEDEITKVINNGKLAYPGGSPKLASAPIYAIFTDPNDSFDGNGNITNGGVNRHGTLTSGADNGQNINMIGVGTGNDANFQQFSAVFSHELQEKMSNPGGRPGANPPPGGTGVVVVPPADIPPYIQDTPGDTITNQDQWDQIADFEPEQGFTVNGIGGYGYIYRIGGPGGAEVQAAYSGADQGFVVEDGTSTVFTLTPNWTIKPNANNDFFDGTFDLTINGDQLVSKDDNITISEDSAGGIEVNLDGQLAYFDPGTATSIGTAIRSINVNGLSGNNTLTLDFTSGNFMSVMNPNHNALPNGLIDFDGGSGVSGKLVIKGGTFTNEIDTVSGPHAGTYSLDGSIVTYLNLAPIVDTSIATNLTIKDPVGADTVTFENDPASPENGFATSEINGSGFEKVDFANKTNVNFDDTSNGSGEVYDVLAPLVGNAKLNIIGSGTGSTLHAPNQQVTWNITGHNSGNLPGLVNSFASVEYLYGNSTLDEFVFFPGGSLDGYIFGGSGWEWLDYENISTSLNINLATGVVPDVAIGAFFINNAIGSKVGGDTITGTPAGGVLVSHGSGNTLKAGNGRSILIGGNGKNTLSGGTADDLIIDGQTIFDSSVGVLSFFIAIWEEPITFAARTNILQGFLIVGNTVTLSSAGTQGIGPRFGRGGSLYASTLEGNGGQNWFFTININSIVDFKSGIDLWTN